MTPQECLYESIKSRTCLTLNEYLKLLEGWEIHPIYENDECIGCAIRKGHEVHMGVIKPNRYIRKILREVLGTTIQQYGMATTTVSASNESGIKFCERLGFERDWEGLGVICMKCVRSPYV